MQQFPNAVPQGMPLGAAVPVAGVAGPARPAGVHPGLTQLPGVPMRGYMPGFPPQAGHMPGFPPQAGHMPGFPPQAGHMQGFPPQAGPMQGLPPQAGHVPGFPPQAGHMPGFPPQAGHMPGFPPQAGGAPGFPAGMPLPPMMPQGGINPFIQAGGPAGAQGAPTYYGGAHPMATQMQAAPQGRPPVLATPGALGVPVPTGRGIAGTVPGVNLSPVTHVAPPAATGGPHPLPPMPEFPLPQGFPNPFQTQQLAIPQGAQGPATQLPPQTSVTGPMGYHPGLGHFPVAQSVGLSAQPGAAPAPGLPQFPPGSADRAPAALPSQHSPVPPHIPMTHFAMPGAQPLTQVPAPLPFQSTHPAMQAPIPGAIQPQAPFGLAGHQVGEFPAPAWAPGQSLPAGVNWNAAAAQAALANPFFSQLALQLLHHAIVKQEIGEGHSALVDGEGRGRALSAAIDALQAQECQNAFRDLSAGAIDQAKFIETFAVQLKGRLHETQPGL